MKISTLGFALLGLLAREPLAGYDLAQRLKLPVGFFWQAGHSQIYPELARLEEAGLVTHEVVAQRDRPDKKLFTPTAAGLDALRDWVTLPPESHATRDELTLKAYSIWLADPVAAARLFRDQAERHERQLVRYEGYRQALESRLPPERPDPRSPDWASYATLRRGIGHETAAAEWCRWMATALSVERSVSVDS